MAATFIDDQGGKPTPFVMGCYGIGVSRIVGAAIEQGNDERGILFPQSIAPFELAIVPLGLKRSEPVREAAEALYKELMLNGIDVVLDDRDERPGVMFADMELIGIPHRVVVSDRGLKEGMLEFQSRNETSGTKIAQQEAIHIVLERVKACRIAALKTAFCYARHCALGSCLGRRAAVRAIVSQCQIAAIQSCSGHGRQECRIFAIPRRSSLADGNVASSGTSNSRRRVQSRIFSTRSITNQFAPDSTRKWCSA
jgi:hypothetical protein